jgi:hypothetical protein
MSAHVFHQDLPGYNPESVLHDGCAECERRSKQGMEGVLALDRDRQLRLWKGVFNLPRTSDCDARLQRELYVVAVFLEGAGISREEVSQRLNKAGLLYHTRTTQNMLDELREDS